MRMRLETDGSNEFTLREGRAEDVPACAALHNAWVDETPWMPRVHSSAETEVFLRDHVFQVCTVYVAEDRRGTLGVIAFDTEGYVALLCVALDMQRKGVGAALIAKAKSHHPSCLMAWSFDANSDACAFYAAQGFHEETRTAGENDEGLPDVLFVWRSSR
ncbi:MAG: GNAT family N-acetyltransferase [Pseudomonadota bacterium]